MQRDEQSRGAQRGIMQDIVLLSKNHMYSTQILGNGSPSVTGSKSFYKASLYPYLYPYGSSPVLLGCYICLNGIREGVWRVLR